MLLLAQLQQPDAAPRLAAHARRDAHRLRVGVRDPEEREARLARQQVGLEQLCRVQVQRGRRLCACVSALPPTLHSSDSRVRDGAMQQHLASLHAPHSPSSSSTPSPPRRSCSASEMASDARAASPPDSVLQSAWKMRGGAPQRASSASGSAGRRVGATGAAGAAHGTSLRRQPGA
jgi:hypothetical protein